MCSTTKKLRVADDFSNLFLFNKPDPETGEGPDIVGVLLPLLQNLSAVRILFCYNSLFYKMKCIVFLIHYSFSSNHVNHHAGKKKMNKKYCYALWIE